MQKILYLHIGTEKTGSTALQAVSAMNRDALMKHGIFYPKTPGERNHVKLAILAADGASTLDLRRRTGLFASDAYELFKAQFGEELRSEIVATSCARICLSNEHLSSRLRSVSEINRLAAVVRSVADSVKIVVYLRPQAELFLSSYSTSIKTGRTKALEPPKRVDDPRYNYELTLSLWAKVFSDENMIVRIYDRKTLVGNDVIRDFYSIMDHVPGSDIKMPKTLNGRLDHNAACFLLEFNKHIPRFLEESLNPERGDIANVLEAHSRGAALTVPAAVLRDIAKTYAQSNAEVARRFLGRVDGRLFADADYSDSTHLEPLTMERAVEISAHLWRSKQRQINEARAQIARLKTKLKATRKPQ